MLIQIIGRKDEEFDRLCDIVSRAIEARRIAVAVEKINDPRTMVRLGISQAPAVLIDDDVKCAGRIPDEEEVAEWLEDAEELEAPRSCGGCCGCSNCGSGRTEEEKKRANFIARIFWFAVAAVCIAWFFVA